MPAPSNDPERLAALLDNRLSARERAEMLAALDASPDDLAVYADAAAALHEVAAADAAAPPRASAITVPVRRWAPPRWRARNWVGLAALLLLAIVPWLWRQSRSSDSATSPAQLVALLRAPASAGALPVPAWGVARGDAASPSASGLAVRLGARLLDLEAAVTTGDSTTATIAADVAALVAALPASGDAAAPYHRLAVGTLAPAEAAGVLQRGWEDVSQLAPAEPLRVGAALEAARVAAVRRDTAFFDSAAWLTALQTVDAAVHDPDTRATARRIRVATQRAGPRDWLEVERASAALLRRLAQ